MKAWGLAILVAAFVLATAASAQLPAISWTCPMHPDVLEDRKGACHICGMDLEPVRLVLLYTCPVHAVIEQSNPGKCRICARELMQKTAALTFTCAANRDLSQIEPGRCPDGSAMVPRYTPRAHGDHNPKHGGIFFMAPDNRHHLEGAYPTAGRFRVYVYDDFSKPLTLAQARKVRGRVVTKEALDPKTGASRELASTPLVLSRNGDFLEARIEPLALPATMTAKIAFSADDKESRFDFAFPSYSIDMPAPATPSAAAARLPPATAAAPAPVAAADTGSARAMLTDLKARRAEVESLLKSGTLGAIYVPALQAKDLALELQARQGDAARDAVEAAVKQVVLAAYQLDIYGDLGDAEQARAAFRGMDAAIGRLESLVAEPVR